MRKIQIAMTSIVLGLITAFLLSSCAKPQPHFEVTFFKAASQYTLPGDIKIGRDGYIVIAAQYDATYYRNVHVLVSNIPQDDWWWKQITPVGFFQGYCFYMLPEQYADHNIEIQMANSKVQITSDMQLDRTGIGERKSADFLNCKAMKEWQENDWNALVDLTVHAYANNPFGGVSFFSIEIWDGARLVDEIKSFSKSQTLIIESINKSLYRFEQDFSNRLLNGDSDAMALAIEFLKNPIVRTAL